MSAKLDVMIEADREREVPEEIAIFVGGLSNSGKSEFIDNLVKTCSAGRLRERIPDEETAVHRSVRFDLSGVQAYCLRLPCLCDRMIHGRILARIADSLTKMDRNVKVLSFVYLVNDSQTAADVRTHGLHLGSWSSILGTPRKQEAPKLLVASSLLHVYPLDIRDLCSIWEKNISGTEVRDLMPHNEARESVRREVYKNSEMTVQLRDELQRRVLLRKTAAGRHYEGILKKRHMELVGPKDHQCILAWRRLPDPGGALAILSRELGHWRKCKLPLECKGCLFA